MSLFQELENIIKIGLPTTLATKKRRIIAAALIYQFLIEKWTDKTLTLDKILIKHPDIGLIGPGNGLITWILDGLLKRSQIICTHAILHDAFGRVYIDYKVGPGYCYALYHF